MIFYPRMKYPPLAFSNVNWCKIDAFTSSLMVLHHKMSQNIKIKVNRHTNIYYVGTVNGPTSITRLGSYENLAKNCQFFLDPPHQKKNCLGGGV